MCCKGYFCFIFAETVGFFIIFGSLKRYSQLHWCCHYQLFCFKIGFLLCTANIGAGIAYYITQLICFIKFVHQIFHCHTALPQMGLFLVTDLSQIFSIFKILFRDKINEKSLDIFGNLLVSQVKHVHVSPIMMEKF